MGEILNQLLPSVVSLGVLIGSTATAEATDFTAGVVMKEMTAEERHAYLAGVVEGLAYSRYAADGKETTGMKCVYGWFYDDPKTTDLIYAAFGRYPDYTPGAVVAALVKRKCG